MLLRSDPPETPRAAPRQDEKPKGATAEPARPTARTPGTPQVPLKPSLARSRSIVLAPEATAPKDAFLPTPTTGVVPSRTPADYPVEPPPEKAERMKQIQAVTLPDEPGHSTNSPSPAPRGIEESMNAILVDSTGVPRVSSALFEASFREGGFDFVPRQGARLRRDCRFGYELASIGDGARSYFDRSKDGSAAGQAEGNLYAYARPHGIVERYVVTTRGVEQQFLLERPLAVEGELRIEGKVDTALAPVHAGRARRGGTRFEGPDGTAVNYGAVTVIDAAGARLSAAVEAAADSVSIVIDGAWLRAAAYPVLVDPLVNANFVIGNDTSGAGTDYNEGAHVAYSQTSNLYMVVWRHTFGASDGNILAQRVDKDGTLLGGVITVSALTDNEKDPCVAWDSNLNRFGIIWSRLWNPGGAPPNAYYLRMATYSAAGALVTGPLDWVLYSPIAISHNARCEAVFNSTNNEYFLAFDFEYSAADHDVYAARFNQTLVNQGYSSVVASANDETNPDVSYNSSNNRCTVPWMVNFGDWDVWAERIVANNTASQSATTAISAGVGIDEDYPTTAANSSSTVSLIVYEQVTDILGQRFDTATDAITGAEISICTQGSAQRQPHVVYNAKDAEYLVAWEDDRDGNTNIYGQRVFNTGILLETAVGTNFSISTAANTQEDVRLAWNSSTNTTRSNGVLAVWEDFRNGTRDDVWGTIVEGQVVNISTAPNRRFFSIQGSFTNLSGVALPAAYIIEVQSNITYDEQVSVSGITTTAVNTLTLRPGAGNTPIVSALQFATSYCFYLNNATGYIILNGSNGGSTLTIRDADSTAANGFGVWINTANNTVTNCTITANDSTGIYVNGVDSNTITNNTCNSNGNGIQLDNDCDSNTITGNTCNTNSLATGNQTGILFIGTGATTPSGNTVNSNTCNGNPAAGISAEMQGTSSMTSGTFGNTGAGNTCNSNITGYGMDFYVAPAATGGFSGVTIRANTCNLNFNGINIEQDGAGSITNLTISDNSVASNTSTGIYLDDVDSSAISGNGVSSHAGAGDSGIRLAETSASNTITSNRVWTNADGIWVESTAGAGNVIRNNTFYNNSDDAYDDDTGAGSQSIRNSIFVITGAQVAIEGAPTATYNMTYSTASPTTTQPWFINVGAGTEDFHVQSVYGSFRNDGSGPYIDANTSTAIDAGDPFDDYSSETQNRGDAINCGAYGGRGEASRSATAGYIWSSTAATTDWATGGNWLGGSAPPASSTSHVLILSGAGADPTFNEGAVTIGSLRQQSGSTLTMFEDAASDTLTVGIAGGENYIDQQGTISLQNNDADLAGKLKVNQVTFTNSGTVASVAGQFGTGSNNDLRVNEAGAGTTSLNNSGTWNTDVLVNTGTLQPTAAWTTGGWVDVAGTLNLNAFNVTIDGTTTGLADNFSLRIGTSLTMSSGTPTLDINGTSGTTGHLVWLNGSTETITVGTINVTGNWLDQTTATDVTLPSAVLVQFDGPATSNGTITPAAGSTFWNATFNPTAGTKTLGATMVINGGWTMSSGSLDINGQTLDVNANATLSGGTLTMDAAADAITITGNWTESGTFAFAATNGTVTFDTTAAVDNTITHLAANNFYHVTKTGASANRQLLAGPMDINGNFLLSSGSWDPVAVAQEVAGNWTNNGTYNTGTSTVTMNGTTQTIGGSASTVFYNLTIAAGSTTTVNPSAGINTDVSATLNVNVGGILVLANSRTLRIGTGAATGTLNISGELETNSGGASKPRLTAVGGAAQPLDFNITGTVDVNGLLLDSVNGNGMDFFGGATITQLDYVDFSGPPAAGTRHYITVTSATADAVCDNCTFAGAFPGTTADSNVKVDVANANLWFTNYGGAGAGDAQDFDLDDGSAGGYAHWVVGGQKYWVGPTAGSISWNLAINWAPPGVPIASDVVYVVDGIAFDCNNDLTTTISALTVKSNGQLTINTNTLTVTSSFNKTGGDLIMTAAAGVLDVTDFFVNGGGATISDGDILVAGAVGISGDNTFDVTVPPAAGQLFRMDGAVDADVSVVGANNSLGRFSIQKTLSTNIVTTAGDVTCYDLDIDEGIFTIDGHNVYATGTSVTTNLASGGTLRMWIDSAVLETEGGFTMAAGSAVDLPTGTLKVRDDFNTTAATFNPNSNHTTIFDGVAAQVHDVSIDAGDNFHHLTISPQGGGVTWRPATASSALNVTGDFTINAAPAGVAANVSMINGALLFTMNLDGAFTMVTGAVPSTFTPSTPTHAVAGPWDDSGGTFQATAGTINFDAAAGTQTIKQGAANYLFNVTKSGAATRQIAATSADVDINGAFTISGGTWNANSIGMEVRGNWTNDATFTAGTGTVTLNAPVAQTIGGSASTVFYNLTIAGGTTTINPSAGINTDVGNTLTVNGGTTIEIGDDRTLRLGRTGVSGTANISGILLATGGTTNKGTITATDTAFRHDFNVLGTTDVNGLIFEYANVDGMDVTGFVANLNNVAFQNIAAGGYHLRVRLAANTFNSRGCTWTSTAGAAGNVYAEDTTGGADAGGDVICNFEFKSAAIHGAGAGEAFDYDDDLDGDGFSETGEGNWPATDRGAVVNWIFEYPVGGALVGYPQGALRLDTYAWYATYTAINGADGNNYILVLDASGNVAYYYSFSSGGGVGTIVGSPWWDNDYDTGGSSRWLYFGTTGGYLYRLSDTGAALALTWSVNLVSFAPDCVEVTSPVVSDGTRVYFGGRQDAVPTYRMYSVADSAAAPTGWAWTFLPVTATAMRSSPSLGTMGGTSFLYAASDMTGGAAHVYKLTASTGAISQDNSTSKAHDIKAPITLGGISAFTMRAVVGDYGGRMHMVDADTSTFLDYSGFPYLWPGHALGAVSIQASALFDWVEELTYYGDSDGHIFVITESPALYGTYPKQFEAGQAITAAPLYEGLYIYTGNANGKVFVITKTDGTLFKQLEIGAGITVGDMAYIDHAPVGAGAEDRIAFNAENGKTYYMTVPP